jgi:hypothetical protein
MDKDAHHTTRLDSLSLPLAQSYCLFRRLNLISLHHCHCILFLVETIAAKKKSSAGNETGHQSFSKHTGAACGIDKRPT